MTTRDEEIDAYVREGGRPYVHKPDEVNVDIGGLCFLDRHRMCGPDCTAFVDPAAPTGIERCVLLSAASAGIEGFVRLARLARERPRAPDIAPPSPFAERRGP